MKKTGLVSLCSLLAACSAGSSEENLPTETTPVDAACNASEFSDMDFWVGVWDLSWAGQDGKTATGRNIISKDPFGNCVVTERFDGGTSMPLKGISVSTWHAPTKAWRQTWVDNQGGYYALSGGKQTDGTFVLGTDRRTDTAPYQRMVFENIEADSLTWRWQRKIKADDTWSDQWVIEYVRKK